MAGIVVEAYTQLCRFKGQGDACKDAVIALNILYNHGVLKPKTNWEDIQKLLQDKRVTIGVLGRHNTGKTTLLNALLHDSYLPVHRKANSAVPIIIEHKTELDLVPCCKQLQLLMEVEPVLEEAGEVVARGKLNVVKAIQSRNQTARGGNETREKNKELVLRVNMPLLAAPSHDCDAVLMDTPGFFEAVKDITKVAELSLESSCVYLFVMKYDQLRDTGDGEIFKKLLSSDKSFSINRRIVFAVTKYDQYYAGEEDEELEMQEVRETVKDRLMEEIGIDVECDQIVPVCAQWALKARQLKNNLQDPGLFKKARHFLENFVDCSHAAHGENLCINDLDNASVATELEKAANIAQLEERLKEIVSVGSNVLHASVKSKIEGCIASAVDGLLSQSTDLEKKLEDTKGKKTHLSTLLVEIADHVQKLKDKINGTDDVVKSMTAHEARQDSERAVKKLLDIFDGRLAEFEQNYKQVIRRRQYTWEDFDTADTNLKERSEKDVNSLIQESKFECARRKCDNETIRGKTSSHLKDIQFRLGKLIPVQFNLLEDPLEVLMRELERPPLVFDDVYQAPERPQWGNQTGKKGAMLVRTTFLYRKDGQPADFITALRSKGPYPKREDIKEYLVRSKANFEPKCCALYFGKEGMLAKATEIVYRQYCDKVEEKLGRVRKLCQPVEQQLNKLTEDIENLVRQIESFQNVVGHLEKFRDGLMK